MSHTLIALRYNQSFNVCAFNSCWPLYFVIRVFLQREEYPRLTAVSTSFCHALVFVRIWAEFIFRTQKRTPHSSILSHSGHLVDYVEVYNLGLS